MPNLAELASRADIVRLVDAFYDRVRRDGILGPIFNDVARVDWELHLPKMYDFWESVLFGKPVFKGAPLPVHLALSRQVSLTSSEFDRWIALFHVTVDALFIGPLATEAKIRALRIAAVMQHHIAHDAARSLSPKAHSPKPKANLPGSVSHA
jgi:hemoglobin